MLTHEANRVAVGGHAKAVREALKSLGMRRCSVRLVRYQCEARADRLNWYQLFFRWFEALWVANREGAEFLFEDFRARVLALRAKDAPDASDWLGQIATCAREHGEALQAAIQNRDAVAIRRELAESIIAERQLMAMIDAREADALAA